MAIRNTFVRAQASGVDRGHPRCTHPKLHILPTPVDTSPSYLNANVESKGPTCFDAPDASVASFDAAEALEE